MAPEALEPPPEVEVPFGCGRSFVVSQAHHTGSHLERDAHAWDFRMPEGEPIVAAADGVVRMARGDSALGGCDASFARHANYVVVSHEGGVETQYLHFSKVVVKSGDRVKAGQLLGFSGRTGWACGAHLHFKVAQAKGNGWNNPSLPARVAGYGDPDVGTWIHAPRCTQERPFIASLGAEDRPAPPRVADGGTPDISAGGPGPALTPRR